MTVLDGKCVFGRAGIAFFVGKAPCKNWGSRLMNINTFTEKLRLGRTQGTFCLFFAIQKYED
jgi:hypothetical protein